MRGTSLTRRPVALVAVAATCALAGALPAFAGGPGGNGGEGGGGNGGGNDNRGLERAQERSNAQPHTPAATGQTPAAQRSNGSRGRGSGGGHRAQAPRPAPAPAPAPAAPRPASPAGGSGGGSGRAAGRGSGRGARTTPSRTRATSGSGGPRATRTRSGSGSDRGPRRAREGDSSTTSDTGSDTTRERSLAGGGGATGSEPATADPASADGATTIDGAGGDPLRAIAPLVPIAGEPAAGDVPTTGAAPTGSAPGTAPGALPGAGVPAPSGPLTAPALVLTGGEAFGVSPSGAPVPVPVGRVGLAGSGPVRQAVSPERARRDFAAAPTDPPVVTRTVREIVEVVPGPVKAALVILALLALALGAGPDGPGARAGRLERQRRDLLAEVGLLQTALLPEVPARLGELVSTFAYRPADGPAAGGDFYDAFAFDGGRVGIVVGDVAGHGREALARTALIRYTLRAYLDAGLEPRAALKVAGSVLDDDLGADFATVVVAVFDPSSGTLTYAAAGHPPPILLGPPAHEPVTACSSPPLGAGATTGLRQTTVALAEGSIACFFTDGLVEARVAGGLLGRERLVELLEGLGPDAGAEALLAAVVADADRVGDDMAACILRPERGAQGTLRVEELEVAEPDLRAGGVERFLRACGIPVADVPGLLRETSDTVRSAGTAILRVRTGDWRPGVDVLPGNVEVLVRTPLRAVGAADAS